MNYLKREILKSKIHRAVVTDANLDYIGSLTLDENLMDAANLCEFEKVDILNLTNGNRLQTYIIKGERGLGDVCINGAAAHLVSKDNLVIIVSYCILDEEEIAACAPTIIHVDKKNKVI